MTSPHGPEPEKIRDTLIAQCSRHDIPLVVSISSPGRGAHGLPLGLRWPRGTGCSSLGGSDDIPIIVGASCPIRGTLVPLALFMSALHACRHHEGMKRNPEAARRPGSPGPCELFPGHPHVALREGFRKGNPGSPCPFHLRPRWPPSRATARSR